MFYQRNIIFFERAILILLFIVIAMPINLLFSQNSSLKPTRQSSFEAYSKGDFENAYVQFSELLVTYSKDPLYKYYSGLCLIKLNRDSEKAESLFKEALNGAAIVKTLPSDARFYLGRAQQMSGKYKEAIASFNIYIDQAGRKAAKEQNVAEYIKQCVEEKGALEIKGAIKTSEVKASDTTQTSLKEVLPTDIKSVAGNEILIVGKQIPLPVDYEKLLDSALNYQYKADSVYRLLKEMKSKYDLATNDKKTILKSEIGTKESLAASYQSEADMLYDEAQSLMNPARDNAPGVVEEVKSENVTTPDSVTVKLSPVNPVKREPKEPSVLKMVDNKPDTAITKIETIKKPIERYSVFEVLTSPVTGPNEKIAIDKEVPEGLIYRIQVAVFRNPVAPSYFKGITPIYGFRVAGSDNTNYYAGLFRRVVDARKALATVKSKGFKDAFIVSLMSNKAVSTDRAAQLEKEWSNKPFYITAAGIEKMPVDTLPPTLSFRVEIIRTAKPVKEEVFEDFKKIAGNRGLDIITLDDGQLAYVIGKFITFESAAEYADLIIRNGYSEAHVTSWLGKKEISVDIAKQLFENL